MVMNFYYCAGWDKPICVPMDTKLSPNQLVAVKTFGEAITRNVICADQIPSPPKVKELLNSKHFDYAGNAVEYMQDLDAKKVIATWPEVGAAGVRPITDFLSQELLLEVRNPSIWWLPEDRKPTKRTRSKIRATDETWYKICQAVHQRNMMKVVQDSQLERDVDGHFIVSGAGAVVKKKDKDGKIIELQRFISVLVPTNEHSVQLSGE